MIDFSFLSPAARDLLDDRLMPLGPGAPNMAVRETLIALTPQSLFAMPVMDEEFARACLSGLWLWHDFLDESHSISQEIHTSEGSWWHAIMHRREPDPSNSKYWFRRVGKHSAFARLGSSWDPLAFVDECERAVGAASEQSCREKQRDEWRALFDYCARRAVGQVS